MASVNPNARPARPVRLVHLLSGSGVPPELEGCPFIDHAGSQYALANLYLEERYTGAWSLAARENTVAAAITNTGAKRAGAGTVKQAAFNVADLINWCAIPELHGGTSLRIEDLAEIHIDQYQAQMKAGTWSESGQPLAPQTIAIRLGEAIGIACWAEAKGHRGPVDFRIVQPSEPQQSRARYLAVAVSPRDDPVLPPANIDVPLMLALRDAAYSIAALLMMWCGLRRQEVCDLLLAAVPIDRLSDGSWAVLLMKVLGKGNKLRKVTVGRHFVEIVASYCATERPRRLELCLNKYGVDSPQYWSASRSLLLNSVDGRPLGRRSLWVAIKKAGEEVGLRLTLHMLRHWYAAKRLRDRAAELKHAGQSGPLLYDNLIKELALVIAELRDELGHASVETTYVYLRGYIRELSAPGILKKESQLLEQLK